MLYPAIGTAGIYGLKKRHTGSLFLFSYEKLYIIIRGIKY